MRRPWVANTALLVGSSVLALVASEVVARTFVPSRTTAGEAALFEYEPRLGWQFVPNGRSRVRIPDGHETLVVINEHGMRDGSYAFERPPGVERVAVVGDSFLVGLGVEPADLLTARLAGRLRPGTEVMNFGVNGYGPIQELLLVADRVRLFRPDLVVLLLYLGNDLEDLDGSSFRTGYQRPLGRIVDGQLVIDRWPDPPRPLDRFLFGLWRVRLYELSMQAARGAPAWLGGGETRSSGPTPEQLALLRATLDAMARRAAEFGSDLLVVTAPTAAEVETLAGGSADQTAGASVAAAVRDFAADKGLTFLDLSPELARRAALGFTDYFPAYRHWNASGHSAVAAEIGRLLDTAREAGYRSSAPGPGDSSRSTR